jgi:hypothetical protein
MTEAKDRTVLIEGGETVTLALVDNEGTHRLVVDIQGAFLGSQDAWKFGTLKMNAYMDDGHPNTDFVTTHAGRRTHATTVFAHSHLEDNDDA